MRISMEVSKETKTSEIPFDSSKLLLGILSPKLKILYFSDIYIAMYIAAQFTIAQFWK